MAPPEMPPPQMPPPQAQSAADYDEYRPLMFSIAYRMTGSVGDAEDIVQDAFVRLTRALRDGARIDSPKAYLATVTTRLAISHLRSARVRREAYVGAWLPEPLVATERGPYARSRGARRDVRFPVDGVPRPAGKPLADRTRRVPPARGLRLRLRRDRRDHRQVRGELPADLRPRPAPHRRGQAPVRRLPRAARRGGPPFLRRRRRRRPGRAAEPARPGRGHDRRRRRQGPGPARVAARAGTGRPVHGRAVPAGAEGGHATACRPWSTASRARWPTTPKGGWSACSCSTSPTAWCRRSAPWSTRTSSPTSARPPTFTCGRTGTYPGRHAHRFH